MALYRSEAFLTRPYGAMFGSTGGLFGPAGFSGMRRALLLLHHSRLHASSSSSSSGSRGLLVEEVVDDLGVSLESRHCEQIVEHPDDVVLWAVSLANEQDNQLLLQGKSSSDGGLTGSLRSPLATSQGSPVNLSCSFPAESLEIVEVTPYWQVMKRPTICRPDFANHC